MAKHTRTPEERLAAEAEAVKLLKRALANDTEDAELFRDMVEGETSFFEMIDAIYEHIQQDDELLTGIKARKDALDARRKRIEERKGFRRAKIEMALMVYGEKIERPEATFSLRQNPPSVVISDEEAIPAKYWKPGAPVLDKALLLADLKERQSAFEAELEKPEAERRAPDAIPGATLNNAPQSLTIRVA